MESFEHLCKVALEAEHFVVTSNLKFFVRRKTRKAAYEEYQEHGYEIDLIGARADKLVLAEVKSYFGSAGVNRQGFRDLADEARPIHYDRYKLFNEPALRAEVCAKACERFGYRPDQLILRMYVGKFASGQEHGIRAHLSNLNPPVEIVGLNDIVAALIGLAQRRTYTDDPVIMTIKALTEAGQLQKFAASKSKRT